MKRILISCVALVLMATMLFSCSAYDNPTKYIDAPGKGEVTISAAEIAKKLQEQIDTILDDNRYSDYIEVKDEAYAAQKGDQVTILYKGTPKDSTLKLSATTLAGMTNKGETSDKDKPFDLVLGSGSFIGAYTSTTNPEKNNQGFEDQLVGAKKNDKVTVTVTFPDNYSTAELKGVVVNFEVEVLSIARCTVDDKSEITVEYDFAEVKDESTDKDDDTAEGEDNTNEGGDNTAAAQDEADTNTNTDTDTDTDTDKEDGKEEDKKEEVDITKSFKSGKFSIDYTALDKVDGTFNDLFKIADYVNEFKGQYLEAVIEKTVVIDTENEKYTAFNGMEIKITFTISEITILPEWNDELVKEVSEEEYTSADEYKKYLEDVVKQDLAYEAILAATKVTKYPEKELKDTYKNYVDYYVSQQLEGGSPNDYTSSELKEILTDDVYAKIYDQAAKDAHTEVKKRLVLEYLIDELGIELTNKEYKEKRAELYEEFLAYYGAYAAYVGVTDEKSIEDYYGGKEALELTILSEKLYEVIVDYVTIGE